MLKLRPRRVAPPSLGSRLRGGDAQDSELVCVVRLLPDGRLDTSFSGDGVAVLDHGYGNDSAEAVVLQGRRVVVAGEGRDSASGSRFGVARFRRDGTLDRSFGAGGIALTDFRTGSDQAAALALMPGRAVAAGAIYSSLGIARFLTE
jgi:hypothetical protein